MNKTEITRRKFIELAAMVTGGVLLGTVDPTSNFLGSQFGKMSKCVPRIKVLGIGQAGCNSVEYMMDMGLKGVEFIVANADLRALESCSCPLKISMCGKSNPKGFCCWGDPERGYLVTLESKETIKRYLKDADVVIVVGGMGAGLGSGGAPVVARIGQSIGAWTISVVTTPFDFEGRIRLARAENGVRQLEEIADMTAVIPLSGLRLMIPGSTTLGAAFRMADELLLLVVRAFTNLLVSLDTNLFSLEFAEIRRRYSCLGKASVGISLYSRGGVVGAMKGAISSPLLGDFQLEKAKMVIVNIICPESLTLSELNQALELLEKRIHKETDILWNFVPGKTEKFTVTLIGAGFSRDI